MNKLLEECRLCPRNCGVNRIKGEMGACHETAEIMVARAALHMWEEPCISGEDGSGAIFFGGCQLGCCFCQNRKISTGNRGKVISVKELCDTFFELKRQGANNINLVTPDHYVPQIIVAIDMAKEKGFDLPFVYNCSGYEKVEMLKLLEGRIDIYLPDFKYMSGELAAKYSKAPDYPDIAKAAIDEMFRQCGGGHISFDKEGIMKKGIIVRHLQLPGQIKDSKEVIQYLNSRYGEGIYISIMNQYTPMPGIEEQFPELADKLTDKEYDELVDYAISIGVENGFIQEGDTASESFIPEF
ncbi:MAG: radical SAM protein [Coprococcus sp.]